jgi:hypothetical protein
MLARDLILIFAAFSSGKVMAKSENSSVLSNGTGATRIINPRVGWFICHESGRLDKESIA